MIESGRYVRKKLTERLFNCNVEDEIHFICLCSNLNNIKSYYFFKLNIHVCENYMEQFIKNNGFFFILFLSHIVEVIYNSNLYKMITL